ncbi:MAG: uncharacterized protein K0S91_865 [Nitrososphaeraceae archaeon]|jgi:uncharacterized membrane protein (UPF0127 family)|nr:uncharacterized protein [Nitrososphaeraceae archaeon]
MKDFKVAHKYLQTKVTINNFDLTVYLAMTNEQIIKGLVIKDQLKENEGMLFVYQLPAKYTFSMRGMKFPIDIIWLDNARKVIHIEHSLEPCPSDIDCPKFIPSAAALYVLETIAGFSNRHDVKIGTQIDFHLQQ